MIYILEYFEKKGVHLSQIKLTEKIKHPEKDSEEIEHVDAQKYLDDLRKEK